MESADFVIHVKDLTDERPELVLSREADLRVRTKCDLSSGNATNASMLVSAASGSGLDELKRRMSALAFRADRSEGLALNARHLDAITDARTALARAKIAVTGGRDEFIAFDLRESLNALGRILGAVSTDDLLGRIFSAFCIGK